MDYHQEVISQESACCSIWNNRKTCTRTRSDNMKLCFYRNVSLSGILVFVVCLALIPYSIALSPSSTAYLDQLLQQYGSNESLSLHQLRELIDNVIAQESGHGKTLHSGEDMVVKPACNWTDVDWSHSVPECAVNTCLSADDMFAVQDVERNETLNRSHLHDLGPMLLFEAQKDICHLHEEKNHESPPSEQTWGYGFLFVTIINICSLVGVIVLPVMKKKIYKQVLMTLVGLAVGSLAATGLIVLIPKAWGLVDDDPEADPVPRVIMSVTVFGGIYLFFLLERFLRLIMEVRKKRNNETSDEVEKNHDIDEDVPVCSVIHKTPQSLMDLTKMKDPSMIPDSVQDSCVHLSHYQKRSDETNIINGSSCASSMGDSRLNIDTKTKSNGETNSNGGVLSAQHGGGGDTDKHGHSHGNGQQIASLAWMIIFGDALHNFIDGLSIGAAFTESLMSGVSVSIAVICEELPHELGDFAILLKSGMSLKQALFYNFLSATTCYLGLIVGILLGENTGATLYIFAMAGGMFLYISLVDMVPEMNNTAEEEEKALGTIFSLRVFILQNLGIMTGFTIIALMSIYDRHIDFKGS